MVTPQTVYQNIYSAEQHAGANIRRHVLTIWRMEMSDVMCVATLWEKVKSLWSKQQVQLLECKF